MRILFPWIRSRLVIPSRSHHPLISFSSTVPIEPDGPLRPHPQQAQTVRLSIRLKPSASANRIMIMYGSSILSVQVTAHAQQGQANKALIHYLSKVLGVRKTDIQLERGSTSRTKILLLHDTSPTLIPILRRRLEQVAQNDAS
ncbi:MAG: hypothetical protein DHS80DRAFT_28413 [Piptocephalis tieghemiana]|nr:MAG: hypothetical protein DHS80DRAFT_28413 [Piptocephalis tieghemiana]